MDLNQIREFSLALPGAEEKVKWENHLCFCVGDKMFLVINIEETPISASFKVASDDFEEVVASVHFEPAPYLARYQWVYLSNIDTLSAKDLANYIESSYWMIFEKLPANLRNKIAGQRQ